MCRLSMTILEELDNNDNFNKEIVYNNVDANQNISLITEVIPT